MFVNPNLIEIQEALFLGQMLLMARILWGIFSNSSVVLLYETLLKFYDFVCSFCPRLRNSVPKDSIVECNSVEKTFMNVTVLNISLVYVRHVP